MDWSRYGSYWPLADMPKNAIDVAIGDKADIASTCANVRMCLSGLLVHQFNHNPGPELYSGNTFEKDYSLQFFFPA